MCYRWMTNKVFCLVEFALNEYPSQTLFNENESLSRLEIHGGDHLLLCQPIRTIRRDCSREVQELRTFRLHGFELATYDLVEAEATCDFTHSHKNLLPCLCLEERHPLLMRLVFQNSQQIVAI